MADVLVEGRYSKAQLAVQGVADAARNGDRYWLSNPRESTDPTWEIINIAMRTPVTINHISFSLLNVSQNYEVYMTTPTGVRLIMIDDHHQAVKGTIRSDATDTQTVEWTSINKTVLTTIVSKIEVRVQRIKSYNTASPFSLGIRDILLEYDIHSPGDTVYPLGLEVDTLGNVVRRQVKQWTPALATDNDSYTYWKSEPQPSPSAVVSMYMSLYNPTSAAGKYQPVHIDTLWIDPIYSGCRMNLYYSNDDVMGMLYPQPFRDKSYLTNAKIVGSKGIDLTSDDGSYHVKTGALMTVEGAVAQSAPLPQFGWIGIEMDMGDSMGSPTTIFYGSNADTMTGTNMSLTYDPSTGIFSFDVGGTSSTVVSSDPVSYGSGRRVQIVCSYQNLKTGPTARLIVGIANRVVSDQSVVSSLTGNYPGFKKLFAKSQELIFGKQGMLREFIIKVGTDTDASMKAFIGDPYSYLMPPPLNDPQRQGRQPKSFLDNAIYVGEYTSGEDGYGGVSEEFYTEKAWTPVWKDWRVERGFYYLPKPILAKHLKFEFSGLTPQPYPMHEENVSVNYLVYPQSAKSQSGITIPSDTKADSGTVTTPSAFRDALNFSILRTFSPKTRIFLGSQVVENIRNEGLYDSASLSQESIMDSSIQADPSLNPGDIASAVMSLYGSDNSPVQTTIPSSPNSAVVDSLLNNSSPTLSVDGQQTTLGSRTPGWWLLPGGELKLPADVMQSMTATSTTTEIPANTSDINTLRARFPTTSVHRYDVATAVRDAEIAYFAGVREVRAFYADITLPVDDDQYDVPVIDETVIDAGNSSNYIPGSATAPARPVGSTIDDGSGDGSDGEGDGSGSALPAESGGKYVIITGLDGDSGTTSGSVYTATTPASWDWHPSVFPTGAYPLGISHSPTLGVYVAYAGTAGWRSTDGLSWVSISPFPATVRGMYWAPEQGVFVAGMTVGDGVLTSPDGEHWAQREIGAPGDAEPSYQIQTAASSGSRIVITGGTLGEQFSAYSTDAGATWTYSADLASKPDAGEVRRVVWASGLNKFVACDSKANTYTSDDGDTWDQVGHLSFSGAFNDLVWADAQQLLVAIARNYYIMTSPDGVTWTSVTSTSPGFGYLQQVVYSPYRQEVVAITSDPGSSQREILYSTDCVSWTSLMKTDQVYSMRGIVWAGEISPPIIELKTFNSIGTFRKIKVFAQDAGFTSYLNTHPTPISAVGLNTDNSTFWNSDTVNWSDSTAVWGARSALVGVDLQSNLSFQGQMAAKVYRDAGDGVAGVGTGLISVGSCQLRMCISIYRPKKTSNKLLLQLEDTTPITGTVLREVLVDAPPGRWTTFKSDFFGLDPGSNYRINFMLSGADEETVYVASLFDEISMTLYEASNDGGAHWYSVMDIVNEPDRALIFPTTGNALKFRITMYSLDQYIYGLTIIPTYMF